MDVPAAARRPRHDLVRPRRRRGRWGRSSSVERRSSGRRATSLLPPELRRSLAGQIEILEQRIEQRKQAEHKLAYIDAELARIEEQVELIREQAALSTDPELLSRRIDEITATLGGTGQWIRDQQQVYGAMEDLLSEPPPLTPTPARRRVNDASCRAGRPRCATCSAPDPPRSS